MPANAPISYAVLQNGIHRITMHESSRWAVDAWLLHMTDLTDYLQQAGHLTYAPVLLDLREPGMMPVGYATYAVKLWTEDHPTPQFIDIAVVYRYGLLAKLAISLTHLSAVPDGVRLFHKGRYDDAMIWLTERIALVNQMGGTA